MLEEGATWFLVADGRRARVLIEPRRGAELQEPQEWVLQISESELYDAIDRPPRAHDSMGPARHAMDQGRNRHEEEEEKFLKRVASRIGEAEKHKAFDHLVIAAPPRALGLLRSLLPSGAQSRVRAETAKDLLDETAPQLRERLRELLR